MAVLRSVRFTTDPELTGAMPGRRSELIEAARERFDGLVETR